MSALFNRVALIGIGLIGSSIAHAARRGGLAGEIVGTARSKETRETALRLGVVDRIADTAAQAVEGADLVILCIPVGAIGIVMEEIAPSLSKGTIVSDVGSVKGAVIAQALPHLPDGVELVPAHPIAGTEKSGPESGFAELFDGRWCILTPLPQSDLDAVARTRAFWEGLGSHVDVMDAAHHDRVLAVTSHVPHLIAYSIVGTASDLETVTQSEVVKYSASGFRDFTRIAASDPTMWRDVFLTNKEATLEVLGRVTEDLFALQRAIRWGDGDALFEHFSRTRAIRQGIVDAGQDTADADFGRGKGEKPLAGE